MGCRVSKGDGRQGGGMKNSTLRYRTCNIVEAADKWEKCYTIGHELGEIGKLIRHMAMHIADLQKKVDSQAEELKRRQSEVAE